MPLRLRLGLLFAVATAAVVALVGLVFLVQLHSSLTATLDEGLRSRTGVLSDQYRSGGPGALRLDLAEDPVQVLTADGRVLASSASLGEQPVLTPAQRDDVRARAATGTDPLAFTTGPEEERTRLLATVLPGRGDRLLVVGTGTDIADTADENVEYGLIILGPPAVLLAGLGAWLLGGAALRPVERMRRQTAEISDRDTDAHLAVPTTRDEIAALATTMNSLLDRQHAALTRERGFVADAGHELRTPLATLRAELELAGRPGRNRDELHRAVIEAAVETDRLIRLSENLLLLARSRHDQTFLDTGTVELRDLLATAARGAAALADPRDIDVVVEGPSRLAIPGDAGRLRQAVDNVLANAVRHSPDHGLVLVTVSSTDHPRETSITVLDDGPGFPEDFLPHAFERFRRADTARARIDGGSGLGLAIVEAITHAHHGCVRAANRPGHGAAITMTLPGDPTDRRPPNTP